MTNTLYLEALIKKKGLKKDFIAEEIGISRQCLDKKMKNISFFTACEITKFCQILGVTSLMEKDRIFFASDVEKSEH